MLPEPLKNLIDQLSKLPEIGPRAATRLSFFLLNQSDQYLKDLSSAIAELKKLTKVCKNCFNLTSDTPPPPPLNVRGGWEGLCAICADQRRDQNIICVVEDILDIIPIERTKRYNGVYHVLGGLIAPIEGITPEKLRIKELEKRIGNLQEKNKGKNIEIILAINPTTEGDTTILYLQRALTPLSIKITRLGRGLSTGSNLEYADETTLINAFLGRR
jgi:recombination protein RecR